MATRHSDPVKITTFPLSTRHVASMVVCGVAMALSARREFIAPGSLIYDHLLQSPQAALTAAKVQDWAFFALVGVHASEVPLFAFTKLRKHGVPFFSCVWWKWAASCFLGGIATWKHFARTVKAAEAKRV
ncbi:hypothetical protein VMCG_06038 [Cytospora schulzeri]|uniref:DUF2470 domain-containing protein n=1 Tax=Cytospora schulzeri TaxID=448051 RepID=A0A423WGD1_9PEZI|nr:hypothetical protein VMCG_06038 [Valsa malicola]